MEKQEHSQNLPLIGDQFPELEVQTTHGKMKLPEEYEGRWFVLFSHPADFTPVCTTEFYSFADHYEDFQELDVELVGLSIDQVFSHLKWTEWIEENLNMEIPFPIIADDQGKIAKKLGMVHPNKGTNTVRAVFVIDPEGKVRQILYYPQELGRNMDEILRSVKALQKSESEDVALPANWPNNELIEKEGIVEPASNEKDAKKRDDEYDCYDWWFCHKELD